MPEQLKYLNEHQKVVERKTANQTMLDKTKERTKG